MDITESTNLPQAQEPKHALSMESVRYLNETRKWAAFIAIMLFIFTGLMVLVGLVFTAVFSASEELKAIMPFGSSWLGIFYVFLGAVYLLPAIYLYNFSTHAAKGLQQANQSHLDLAFKNLKSHYKFLGIFAIVMLGLYALLFIGIITLGPLLQSSTPGALS